MMNIEALVKRHMDDRAATPAGRLLNALTEQAETHAIELREYEATVANLNERIRQLEVERVPDGYVLVPIEPTPVMIAAAWDGLAAVINGTSYNKAGGSVYRAMLAAVQQQKEV